ncbi:MAG: dipeptide epimerase [Methylobacterium mesophilicum]|nr:dipeptide epimerase [Methylobacterium mesophilicum]
MPRRMTVRAERFPIAGTFTISRGSKTEAAVVTCTISEDGKSGWGECVPYARYGESIESVCAQIEAARVSIEAGAGRHELLELLPGGAARNAVDAALWDLEAKLTGRPAWQLADMIQLRALETAYTLSLGTPEAMAEQARANRHRPLLKIKLGTDADDERMEAVRHAAPESRLIVDANEGWSASDIEANLAAAQKFGVALVEQPLPAGHDALLGEIAHPVPICADESVHGLDDLDRLATLYDAVNIKLDKTGGLTSGLELRREAEKRRLRIMVGCMVGTSLGMAPAVLLAQGAEFVDLDGPLLLARDRDPGLVYEGSLVSPPPPALWG